MTVGLTDVITGVPDPRARRLLQRALEAVQQRIEEDRIHAETQQALREAKFRAITDECKQSLPLELLDYVRAGEPIGVWELPAGDGARFWLHLELPGLEAPLMARFERSLKRGANGWAFVDYVIPGIAERASRGRVYPELSLAENYRSSCGPDLQEALASLVDRIAEYRARLGACAADLAADAPIARINATVDGLIEPALLIEGA